MDQPKKGIIRHEALQPLSRHHHHALFVALQAKRVGTEKSKLTVQGMKQEVETFWVEGGNQHFQDEEEIVLPVYAKYQAIHHPEIIEMLLEHVKLRSYVQQILSTEAEADLIPIMNEFGELLTTHVRREERVVFPMIEKDLPEEELQKLAPYLHTNEEESES
jgi:hemerythrin-like domain-containing protein